MQAFSSALAGGALASLRTLNLYENQIGDVGMQAFSLALAGGALANLEELYGARRWGHGVLRDAVCG